MAKRLAELYQPGDKVELKLADGEWRPGQVVQHAKPGVWVVTAGPHFWFVTNGRRIRAATDGKGSAK